MERGTNPSRRATTGMAAWESQRFAPGIHQEQQVSSLSSSNSSEELLLRAELKSVQDKLLELEGLIINNNKKDDSCSAGDTVDTIDGTSSFFGGGDTSNYFHESSYLSRNVTNDPILQEQSPPPAIEEEMATLQEKQDDNNDDDDTEWLSPFGESTYTLLYMCGMQSQAFWYATFVYFIQIATILLTLIDIIDWRADNGNILMIPPMVDIQVTLAQAVTVFLALAYQSDLIEAVLKLHDGYHPDVMEQHPEATFTAWLVSTLAQLLAGFLLLITIFILTMQVDSVLAMMLNFAALHFMAEIDDLGFYIANMGFVTRQLQREARTVIDFKVPLGERSNRLRGSRILYFVTMFGLFAGYAIVKHRQLDGYYLQTYLYVQFGSPNNPKAPYYSGLYYSTDQRTPRQRRYRDVATESILLTYCYTEKAWTFSSDTEDPCDDDHVFAKSPITKSYDVTAIPNSQWLVKDPHSRFVSFDSFTLIGRDCDPHICQGECVNDQCRCPSDLFGLDCEFANVCPELSIDGTAEPFPVVGHYDVSTKFSLMRNTTGHLIHIYNMPVYYSDSIFPATFIFFAGHRWVMTAEDSALNMTKDDMLYTGGFFPNQTANFLQDPFFHGRHDANYVPLFLSEPVDFNTDNFQPTPSGLMWSNVVERSHNNNDDESPSLFTPAAAIDTVLLCKSCLDGHDGFCDSIGGICNETSGMCECEDGFSGDRCEKQGNCYDQESPCSGRGRCDEITGICHCFGNRFGKLCDSAYTCIEEHGRCFNGGICNPSRNGTVFCECTDPNTFGTSCEISLSCLWTGCRNGGTCNEDTGICEDCEPPFYGVQCDLVNETIQETFCVTDEDCNDGGICDTTSGLCECADSGKNGVLCEEQHNCTTSGCYANSICNDDTGTCECKEPFTGPTCSDLPDCITNDDCVSPGVCYPEIGWCGCNETFYYGKLCQDFRDCREVGCFNDGICNPNGHCTCETPAFGPLCLYMLAEGAY